jgi:GAF domain-containing protein
LFSSVHELAFMDNIVEGARFARSLLETNLGSSIGLIHAFDINTCHFVVICQWGLGDDVLLHVTADTNSFVRQVMRRAAVVRVSDPAADVQFRLGRWSSLERPPNSILCAPLHAGGRDLGLIELAQPAFATAFSTKQANALSYVAQHLAASFNSRPMVIDAELVLAAG